jgi:hypothetical protein
MIPETHRLLFVRTLKQFCGCGVAKRTALVVTGGESIILCWGGVVGRKGEIVCWLLIVMSWSCKVSVVAGAVGG